LSSADAAGGVRDSSGAWQRIGASGAFLNGLPQGFTSERSRRTESRFATVNYKQSENQAILLAAEIAQISW